MMEPIMWAILLILWATLFNVSNSGQRWALLFPGLILVYGLLYELGGIVRRSLGSDEE